MPNLISVTSHGTPQDLVNGYSAFQNSKTGLLDYMPDPVKRFAGDVFSAGRGVKSVLSANPLVYVANDLAFPEPMADGRAFDERGRPLHR